MADSVQVYDGDGLSAEERRRADERSDIDKRARKAATMPVATGGRGQTIFDKYDITTGRRVSSGVSFGEESQDLLAEALERIKKNVETTH